MAKNLQLPSKATFFVNLSTPELFKTVSFTLTDENPQTRISTTEIILSILSHDTRLLRIYIISNGKFLTQLLHGFINDKDIGVKNQIVEIIKVLLEADTEMNEFFKLFYEKGIYDLVSPLNSKTIGEPTIPGDPSSNLESFVLYNVIELIIYCIKHHSFRIKHFLVQENISLKILKLTSSNERYLVLGAIRFFRCLVSMKDELYNNHIIQDNLFDPIIEIFNQNIHKYNLLNSAIIELLQFIYKDNIKVLIVYLVERYKELFESITYTDVLKQLILKYEQIKDSYESPEICNNNILVDYEDDEEEEDESNSSTDNINNSSSDDIIVEKITNSDTSMDDEEEDDDEEEERKDEMEITTAQTRDTLSF
eukprot:gene7782-9131_t